MNRVRRDGAETRREWKLLARDGRLGFFWVVLLLGGGGKERWRSWRRSDSKGKEGGEGDWGGRGKVVELNIMLGSVWVGFVGEMGNVGLLVNDVTSIREIEEDKRERG